jgi:MSHA pilin protein MshD
MDLTKITGKIGRGNKAHEVEFRIKNHSGFTIIELIIGVMIIGIAFVAVMFAHTQIQTNSTRVEFTLRSTVLANSIMKVVRSHNFDENESPPWSSMLGPDEPSSSEFDDVDDYIGYVWPSQSAGYTGYIVTTRVFYVNPSISLLDSIGVITDYKRIIILFTLMDCQNQLFCPH